MLGNSTPHILTASSLTIRPTQWGIAYLLMTVVLLIISINYNISLGYYLSFLMMALNIIALIHTWQNLAQLTIHTSLPSTPVFSEETALIPIKLVNESALPRYNIQLQYPSQPPIIDDIAAHSEQQFTMPYPTTRRGWLKLPKIEIASQYPLGLFNVSASIESDAPVLVYAKPKTFVDIHQASDSCMTSDFTPLTSMHKGGDEFIGHRAYQAHDPIQYIDWKASSRSEQLYTKEYAPNQSHTLWLDWQSLINESPEDRISKLTYAVMTCNRCNQTYGLRLPNEVFSTNSGLRHYQQCLKALALL